MIKGCEGLGRKSCSDEARYQEMKQGPVGGDFQGECWANIVG